MINYLNTAFLRRHILIVLSPIFLCACQSASVVWNSDSPGAYASGRFKDGTTYRKPLPFTITYSGSELPRDFPATCAMVNSPTITWPDGVKKDPERVRLCYKENNYISKKPQTTASTTYSLPVEVKKQPPIPYKQDRSQLAPIRGGSEPAKDSQKKCSRLGLVPGTDDFNLCMNSAK